MYVVMLAQSWDCIQPDGHNVCFEWSDESTPDRWLPVFFSYEKAKKLYPDSEIYTVTTKD